MSTTIKPEVSNKNKYWIDRHRYYELKHFVLQYPLWKEKLKDLDGYNEFSSPLINAYVRDGERYYSHVEAVAINRAFYSDRVKMVDEAAACTDPLLGPYILKGILNGLSYDKMNARGPLPCARDRYYNLYRKFFWLLSKARK